MRQVPLTEERVVVELSTSAKPDQLMLGSDVTVPLAAFAAVASSVGDTHSFLGTIALACADMYLVKAACARATKAALCARPPAVVLCGALHHDERQRGREQHRSGLGKQTLH